MRIRRGTGKRDIFRSIRNISENISEKNTGVFFVFLIILFLQIPCIAARSFSRPKSNLDLTLPLVQCRIYQSYGNNTGKENFASDNFQEFLVSSSKDKIYLWDIAARRYLWTTELGMDVVSNIVINKSSLYLVGKSEKSEKDKKIEKGEFSRKKQSYFFKEINKLTGLTNRQTELNLPAGADEKFFLDIKKEKIIAVGQSGGVYFFNNDGGSSGGNLQSGENLSSVPFFSDNELIAGTSDDKIIIIPFDGSGLTTTRTAKTVSAVVSTPDGKIIYGDRQGGVTALNKGDKIKIWKFRAGAEISDITQTPFGVLISSFDNYVYLVSTADGKLVWKRRMPGRTFARPLVRDGFVVIAGLYEPEAEIIELKTGRIVNRLFLETENYFNGAAFLFDHSLVFSTVKGLTGFTTFPGKCAES